MNIKVFIITHKKTDIPTMKNFEVLLVGADNKPEITIYKNKDNEGENISHKNKNYCELTGIYWIWKNIHCDVVGICHYRRFFTKSKIFNSEKYFLNTEDIEKIMKNYDVILPTPFYYEKNILDSVNIAPNKKDIQILGEAIKEISPEYYSTYKKFLHGYKSYLYNMCIMKKKDFNRYCSWLFPILQYVEDNYDISKEDEYRSRLFGFLSERLIKVWIMKNISEGRIKHIRVVKTDESSFRTILHEIKNIYRYLVSSVKKKL